MAADTRTVEQIDSEIKKLADERAAKLEATKATDLETVKKLCKQHGFTATNLRGSLAIKGNKKKDDAGVAVKKPAAKKAAAKKTAKAK